MFENLLPLKFRDEDCIGEKTTQSKTNLGSSLVLESPPKGRARSSMRSVESVRTTFMSKLAYKGVWVAP